RSAWPSRRQNASMTDMTPSTAASQLRTAGACARYQFFVRTNADLRGVLDAVFATAPADADGRGESVVDGVAGRMGDRTRAAERLGVAVVVVVGRVVLSVGSESPLVDVAAVGAVAPVPAAPGAARTGRAATASERV